MIEVNVLGAYALDEENTPTVLLQSGDRVLPISVGPFEAAAISLGVRGQKPLRPMTHDLVLNILAGLRGTLKSVTVYKFEEGTFFAYLTVEQVDAAGQVEQVLRIDTRPSDGIAVAVRAKCPVFVAEEVFDAAGQDVAILSSLGLPGGQKDRETESEAEPSYGEEESPQEETGHEQDDGEDDEDPDEPDDFDEEGF